MVQEHLPAEMRKDQIANAALELVAEYGVRGATVARISERVGISVPAVYAHFGTKREVLLATLDLVFEKIRAIHRSSQETNALERLREIGRLHTSLVASGTSGFVSALFEFIAASPSEGLRDSIGENHLELVRDFATTVSDGQRQGTIRADVDPEQVAWLLVSRHWTEDVAQLIGTSESWNESRSNRMLDFILASIAVQQG
jgi:AcrR family transcriptional regulator